MLLNPVVSFQPALLFVLVLIETLDDSVVLSSKPHLEVEGPSSILQMSREKGLSIET